MLMEVSLDFLGFFWGIFGAKPRSREEAHRFSRFPCQMSLAGTLSTNALLPVVHCWWRHPSIPGHQKSSLGEFLWPRICSWGCWGCWSTICCYMGVSKNRGKKNPNHPILIGFPIIFTIYFGVFLVLEAPICCYISMWIAVRNRGRTRHNYNKKNIQTTIPCGKFPFVCFWQVLKVPACIEISTPWFQICNRSHFGSMYGMFTCLWTPKYHGFRPSKSGWNNP